MGRLRIGQNLGGGNPGDTVSVRLPNGEVVQAKAATAINKTKVLVATDEAGKHYAYAEGEGTASVTTRQITRQRPRRKPVDVENDYFFKVLQADGLIEGFDDDIDLDLTGYTAIGVTNTGDGYVVCLSNSNNLNGYYYLAFPGNSNGVDLGINNLRRKSYYGVYPGKSTELGTKLYLQHDGTIRSGIYQPQFITPGFYENDPIVNISPQNTVDSYNNIRNTQACLNDALQRCIYIPVTTHAYGVNGFFGLKVPFITSLLPSFTTIGFYKNSSFGDGTNYSFTDNNTLTATQARSNDGSTTGAIETHTSTWTVSHTPTPEIEGVSIRGIYDTGSHTRSLSRSLTQNADISYTYDYVVVDLNGSIQYHPITITSTFDGTTEYDITSSSSFSNNQGTATGSASRTETFLFEDFSNSEIPLYNNVSINYKVQHTVSLDSSQTASESATYIGGYYLISEISYLDTIITTNNTDFESAINRLTDADPNNDVNTLFTQREVIFPNRNETLVESESSSEVYDNEIPDVLYVTNDCAIVSFSVYKENKTTSKPTATITQQLQQELYLLNYGGAYTSDITQEGERNIIIEYSSDSILLINKINKAQENILRYYINSVNYTLRDIDCESYFICKSGLNTSVTVGQNITIASPKFCFGTNGYGCEIDVIPEYIFKTFTYTQYDDYTITSGSATSYVDLAQTNDTYYHSENITGKIFTLNHIQNGVKKTYIAQLLSFQTSVNTTHSRNSSIFIFNANNSPPIFYWNWLNITSATFSVLEEIEDTSFIKWQSLYENGLFFSTEDDHTASILYWNRANKPHKATNFYTVLDDDGNETMELAISQIPTDTAEQDEWRADIYRFNTASLKWERRPNGVSALSELTSPSDFISYREV